MYQTYSTVTCWSVVSRAQLIIVVALHGLKTLNEEHAHTEYTMLVGTIAENNYEYQPPNRAPQMGTNQAPQWVSHSYPSHVHRKSEKHTICMRPRLYLMNNANVTSKLDLIYF